MRKASLELIYDGVDISEDIAGQITSFSYTDHADGKADDLQITLEDTRQLWKNSWYPEKGAKLVPVIVCENCLETGDRLTLEPGSFEIDEISVAGPPETVTLKAVSAPVTKSLRNEKKSKAWEMITMQALAAELAAAQSLSLFYSADPIKYRRVEQRDESDLALLKRLCGNEGLSLKISGEKLIIFSGKDLEAMSSVFSFDKAGGQILNYSFGSKTHDIYKACTIKYWDAEAKEEKSYTFTPPDALPVGHVLKINKRVESLADAQKKATAALRSKNKNEDKGTLTLMGHPGLQAGLNLDLTGFGVLTGKYFIEKALHSQTIGGGYTTGLTIRKVLGY